MYGSFYNPPLQKPLFQSLELVQKLFGNGVVQRCNTIRVLASRPDKSWVSLLEARSPSEDPEEEKYESDPSVEQNSARVMAAMIPFLCEAMNSHAESGDRDKLQEALASFKKVIARLKSAQAKEVENHLGYQAGNAFMNMFMLGWITRNIALQIGKSCVTGQSDPFHDSQMKTCINYSDDIIIAIENELLKQAQAAPAQMNMT
ncbi:MAG: hypothetical protein K0R24_1677 [Gammaproteobacteria bacterium]|jgi:hypothetical protein|nr:hypothetical protein [Gammaproteobacteria bacterium]